ncbi:MAG: MarR family winged helix-turn-helix transcriptional regulator [Gammaproteobacteria bacterium]
MNLQAQQFITLFSEVNRGWRNSLDKRLKPLGLSHTRWVALLYLSRDAGPANQKDIAARLGIESASLVSVLDSLEQDGLIARQEDAADRRRKTIHLTDKGARIIESIHATLADVRDELLGNVTARELRTCIDVLNKMRTNAEKL